MDSETRADVFLVAKGYAKSRAEAQATIRAGGVRADGLMVTKPAQMLKDEPEIVYAPVHNYVSRGGVKLAACLEKFQLSAEGRVGLDLGASTGGFTEVMLEQSAKRVYAVDVGHGQLHAKLKRDERVVSLEGLNARDITPAKIPDPVSAITADLSFIGLKLALPPALALAAKGAWLVALVKPQFEVGRSSVGKGGIVRDENAREKALKDITDWMSAQDGWTMLGTMESPIAGGDGNIEYLLAASKA